MPARRTAPERVNALYQQSLNIVRWEMNHLSALVRQGKLNPKYAADLARYVNLLDGMKKATEAMAAKAAKDKSVEPEASLASALRSNQES